MPRKELLSIFVMGASLPYARLRSSQGQCTVLGNCLLLRLSSTPAKVKNRIYRLVYRTIVDVCLKRPAKGMMRRPLIASHFGDRSFVECDHFLAVLAIGIASLGTPSRRSRLGI